MTMVVSMRGTWAEREREANIAYFIQVSDENVDMVPRLLRVLHHPLNVYAIHFDQKIAAQRVDPVVSKLKMEYENVHFMDRELITYKGVTMLLNTISAMDFLLSKDAKWDYFVNLSGSDYPLVSPINLRRLLGTTGVIDRSTNFLQLSPSKAFWKEMKESRFSTTYFDTALTFREAADPKLIPTWNNHPLTEQLGLDFVQGEAWVMLHRSACDFTIHSPYARKLLLLLSATQDPEEHYFPMMLWNHPQLNTTLARHALRGVFWLHEGKKSGQHPYTVDEKDESGNWKFWKRIKNSPFLFVRKLSTKDGPFMDMIDRSKSGVHPRPNHNQVWRSFEHTKAKFGCISNVDARRDESSVMSCFGSR